MNEIYISLMVVFLVLAMLMVIPVIGTAVWLGIRDSI
tara:strand:+ start:529 stop:639 length:111 start_codon:yes stop_codon:yes gene_type:complete